MRVSNGMIFDAGVASINRQTSSLLHLQQQVASGRRILTPSDDPVAAARALEVTQASDVTAHFKQSQNFASSAMGLEEVQLSSAGEILARVRELVVQGGNSSLSATDRKSIAIELRARFDEMLGIANVTDGTGNHIFAGFMGTTKPFGGTIESILAGGEIDYGGDDGRRKLQVSPTRFIEISDSGNDVFNRIRNGNGYFATGYAAGNTGTGIVDSGNITDPAKWNAQPAKNFSINFSIDMVAVPPVTYYDIVDTGSGNSMLTGLAPVLPPTAATGQRVYQSGQPIILKSQGLEPAFDFGGSVLITGAPADNDSFSIAPSSSQSVFATLANLIGALEMHGGTPAANAKLGSEIGFALANLDHSIDNILRVRAQVGSRMNEIESLGNLNEDLGLQYQQTLAELQDLDYAKAISDLTRKQTDLQAAQQSFVKISQLSLFDYL
ncbi:MAG: flagellar hook-associated protein FlgL [Sulfuritalea sp.]|jgi:flagellar hook-associated protein 3 FlgL|nr:flagellar hook-associated protein FlgL [Azonexus sp.]MCC7310387.1 flagellar hook-associated protein FlgL [Sulfuritalea sp.]